MTAAKVRRAGRILIVDDDPRVCWSLGRYLTRAGYGVCACGDGVEAVELLKRQDYDLIVTDIQLPKLNGLALLEWIRSRRPAAKIIVITAFGSPSVRHASIKTGAHHYCEKPVDPELLLRIIQSLEQDNDNGFRGSVDNIDLFDYLQLLLLTRHKHVLEITTAAGGLGRIYLDEGQISHAECDGCEGEEAFFRCLGFDKGSFCTLPWQAPERATITRRGDYLLLEAARRKDEAGRSSSPPHPGENE